MFPRDSSSFVNLRCSAAVASSWDLLSARMESMRALMAEMSVAVETVDVVVGAVGLGDVRVCGLRARFLSASE